MVSSTTRLVGLIGNPVEHSFSPAMQNAALEQAGLDFIYLALAVKEEDLESAIKGAQALGFIGLNVTIPYKEKVLKYLDEVHLDAQKIGAVNTIVFKDGKSIGYNTDIGGFKAALLRHHFEPANKHIMILGAGGAAKAIIYAFATANCASISVGARSKVKAQELASQFKDMVKIEGYDWLEEDFRKVHWDADCIVNTTPVGMDGFEDKNLPVFWTDVPMSAFAADIIYNPQITTFLRQARLRGCRGMNGLAMLVEQGALSYELWFGEEPHREIMYETLVQKL